MVVGIDELDARLTFPLAVAPAPCQRILERPQMQADRGDVRMVHSPYTVFSAVVLLEGRLPRELSDAFRLKGNLHESCLVTYFLVRIADVPAERRKIDGLAKPYTLLEQLFVAHLCAQHDTQFLREETVSGLNAPHPTAVSERQVKFFFARPRVVQQVFGSASVASVLTVCVYSPHPVTMPFERALNLSRRFPPLAIGAIKRRKHAMEPADRIGQGRLPHEDDAAKRSEPYLTASAPFTTSMSA